MILLRQWQANYKLVSKEKVFDNKRLNKRLCQHSLGQYHVSEATQPAYHTYTCQGSQPHTTKYLMKRIQSLSFLPWALAAFAFGFAFTAFGRALLPERRACCCRALFLLSFPVRFAASQCLTIGINVDLHIVIADLKSLKCWHGYHIATAGLHTEQLSTACLTQCTSAALPQNVIKGLCSGTELCKLT